MVVLNRTVLVADDNPLVTQLLAHRLGSRGFNVVAVEDGVKAVEAAHRLMPDILVLDGMMPGLDGFAVIKTLKANDATASIPILMLSSLKGEKDIVGALSAGASDYLVKPFIPEELVLRVKRLLEAPRQ
ncbi:putative chemotaxis regulator CheY [Magnetospirillum sp. XM-1]|uniref:response regulator transcription factor n=1 Tax=Magnetospirillum sp. XM-1 TaxID=1663591 RepID=UPI00073DF12C|nr:response regulator [Magnetospirillum sp. XM-1]CUW41610.1 putative chemotaxis regulator CheY [Magnetospirillum sp. XM-1]